MKSTLLGLSGEARAAHGKIKQKTALCGGGSCHDCQSGCGQVITKPPVKEMRSKQEVLAYRFPALVERLEEELKISKKEAEELVADLVKFLYLCATNTTKFGLSPSKKIDEAWHNFIVFTKEYAKFCETNFGFFIHHNPFTKETREQDVKNSRPASKIAARVFGKELSDNWNSKGDSYAICTCDGNCGCP